MPNLAIPCFSSIRGTIFLSSFSPFSMPQLTWLLLFLGAGLFRLVDIDLLWDILRKEWVALPITGTGAGLRCCHGTPAADSSDYAAALAPHRNWRFVTVVGAYQPVFFISAAIYWITTFMGYQPGQLDDALVNGFPAVFHQCSYSIRG